MTIVEECAASFSAGSRTRGRAYFQQNRVLLKQARASGVHATVRGSYGMRYTVALEWTPDTPDILATCTCPYYEGGDLCKHLWATMLAVEQVGWPIGVTSRPGIRVQHQAAIAETGGAARPAMPARRQLQEQLKVPPRQWEQHLKQVITDSTARDRPVDQHAAPRPSRERRVWYVWNIEASLREHGLVIDYYQQELKKSGEDSKIKRQGIAPGDVSSLSDPLDQRLVQLLLGNEARYDKQGYYNPYASSYRRQSCVLAPVMYDLLLPELCATGRFVWLQDHTRPVEEARPVQWDAGAPWVFRLQCTSDEQQQCWRLRGMLERGADRVTLRQPVLLLSLGIVLFPDRVCRLDTTDDFTWIVTLRQAGEVTIPYTDRLQFLQHWWSMPRLPTVDLPAALQLPTTHVPPVGCFTVLPPDFRLRDTQLYGTLAFQYATHQVTPRAFQVGIVEQDTTPCVILRDHHGEAALLQQLLDLGVQRNHGYYYEKGEYNFSSRRLPALTAALVHSGWIVEAAGVRIRPPGTFKLSVTSGIDWFELDGQFDFDGVTASLPRVLAAVRQGDTYVLLDDGSKGMLPEDWLATYGKLTELGHTNGEAVRFKTTQALLLDALLAEHAHVSVDRGFQRWRQQLQTFDGIKPRSQPRTFRGQLRHYQEEGLGWLHFLQAFHFGGCLADDMGLGKTIQVLALLESRRQRRVPQGQSRQPSLVVVPRSLVFNWIAEAARFTPRLRVLDYTGVGRARTLPRFDAYDLIVTTYGTLRRDIVALKEVRFDYAILDEAQAVKNADAQVAKACRLLQAEHRLAMTGTPVENHLGELWSLFEFLNPGLLGNSAACNAITRNGGSVDTAGLRVLAAGLRPFMLRRTKAQVLTELPEKSEQTVFCDMPRLQRKLYDELRTYYRTSLSQRIAEVGLQRAKIHVLEALLRLRQAACHPGLIDARRSREGSAKIEALLEQLDAVVAEGHKALVFSQFTSLLAIVRAHLDQQGLVYEYLDGRTRKRQEKVARFQEDATCPLFLISLKAGGHGLNLTAADYVFILDPWWNPAVEAQAVDRAHRIGQSRPVFAYRLISRDTVEEKILELQQHKRELADAIVSAHDSVIRHLTAEDLQLLFS
jgi:superfamily II DNA or RNA helicase